MERLLDRIRAIVSLSPQGKCNRLAILAVIVVALAGLGCQQVVPPKYRYTPEGERRTYKRAPRHVSQNFIQRSDPVAYVEGGAHVTDVLSPEQEALVELYGDPEYVRKPFQSVRGEKVDEWLYLRHNVLAQFIDGKRVFQGEVTDIERTLLEWGYPQGAFVNSDDTGVKRQTWSYRSKKDLATKTFSFCNGALIYAHAPN